MTLQEFVKSLEPENLQRLQEEEQEIAEENKIWQEYIDAETDLLEKRLDYSL